MLFKFLVFGFKLFAEVLSLSTSILQGASEAKMAPTHSQMAFVFGILGNIVSFLVYLSPLPTFYRIIKKKSTEGFQSIPYSVALFSSMLLLYYAFLKRNAVLLVTINSIGLVIESLYLIIYLIYAHRTARIYTAKLLIFFNIGAYGLILLSTSMITNKGARLKAVGWICAIFSVCVFASPLSIMRVVVKTKSVEFMPFSLSFCLTICAIMWFFYGLLIKDMFVASPNILGFILGMAQMILYIIYKNWNESVLPEMKVEEGGECIRIEEIIIITEKVESEKAEKTTELIIISNPEIETKA